MRIKPIESGQPVALLQKIGRLRQLNADLLLQQGDPTVSDGTI